METKPDLLVVGNLIRHLEMKIQRIDELLILLDKISENILLKSLLSTCISYFESALVDTIKEYILARPKDIKLDKIDYDKVIKLIASQKNESNNIDDLLLDQYIRNVEFEDNKKKIRILDAYLKIDIDLGTSIWERIREYISRRNCFIHNDLVANKTYFTQAGSQSYSIKLGDKIQINKDYMISCCKDIKNFLIEIKNKTEIKFSENTKESAFRKIWDYIFEDNMFFEFDSFWKIDSNSLVHIGPSIDELKEEVSTRKICLYTAWLAFFNKRYNGEIKYFSDIVYTNITDRKKYTDKLNYLINSFEIIDFQTMDISTYRKQV